MDVQLSQGATVVQELLAQGEGILRELDDHSLNTTGHVLYDRSPLDTNEYLCAVDEKRQHLMAELGELADGDLIDGTRQAAEIGEQVLQTATHAEELSLGAVACAAAPRDHSTTAGHASDRSMGVTADAVDQQAPATGAEKEYEASTSSVSSGRPPKTQAGTAQRHGRDTDARVGAQTDAPVVDQGGQQLLQKPSRAETPEAEKESHAHISSSGVEDLLAKGDELLCELNDSSLDTSSHAKFEPSTPINTNEYMRAVEKERELIGTAAGGTGRDLVDGTRLAAELGRQLPQRTVSEASADHGSDCRTDVAAGEASQQARAPGADKESRAHISMHDGRTRTKSASDAAPGTQTSPAQRPSRDMDASEGGGTGVPPVPVDEDDQQLQQQLSTSEDDQQLQQQLSTSDAAQRGIATQVGVEGGESFVAGEQQVHTSVKSSTSSPVTAPPATHGLQARHEPQGVQDRRRDVDVGSRTQGGGHVQAQEQEELWRPAAERSAAVAPEEVAEARQMSGTASATSTAPQATYSAPLPESAEKTTWRAREPAQGQHEAWMDLRYDWAVRFDSVAEQRLVRVLALVGFVNASVISCAVSSLAATRIRNRNRNGNGNGNGNGNRNRNSGAATMRNGIDLVISSGFCAKEM